MLYGFFYGKLAVFEQAIITFATLASNWNRLWNYQQPF